MIALGGDANRTERLDRVLDGFFAHGEYTIRCLDQRLLRRVEIDFVFDRAAGALEPAVGKFWWVGCWVLEVFIPALAACAKESNEILALCLECFFRNDNRIVEDRKAKIIEQEGNCLFASLLDGERNIGRKIE